MKILHIEAGRRFYGGPRQVAYLIEGLARAGVENVLACPSGAALAAHAPAARIVATAMGGDLDWRLTGRLRSIIARERPDLVHVHSRRGADLWGGRAARAAGLPGVLTRRVDSAEPALWARLKYKPYAAVVAISRHIEAELAGALGLEDSRLRLIASAVDTEAFRPDAAAGASLRRELGLPARTLLVGVVAQLIARKGHEVLLASLAALAPRLPSMRVIFFGRGPLESKLASAIESRGLAATVTLAGHRDVPERWMPGLDVLVHPALREGLGVAVLEAMSSGVPVLTSAAGGLVDVVEDERTGLVVAPGDAVALGRALERMMLDASLRERLAQAARRRVEEEFSVRAMTDRYRVLYESILEQRAPAD